MVATSRHIERATRGVDLTIGFRYTPPEGESREGLTIMAHLALPGWTDIAADSLSFDVQTGQIAALWQEATTARLPVGKSFEARFVRERAGATRLFYTRTVQVR